MHPLSCLIRSLLEGVKVLMKKLWRAVPQISEHTVLDSFLKYLMTWQIQAGKGRCLNFLYVSP